MEPRSLATRGLTALVFGLLLTGLAVLAPASAFAEESALRVSVAYAGHGSYQLSETGTTERQANAEFGWSDLFPALGAIELSGPTVSGPGVGPGNSNDMGGFPVEGLTAETTVGEFFGKRATPTRDELCEASGELEAPRPRLWVTPEPGEEGAGAGWSFEIAEAGGFADYAGASSGDAVDCGIAGNPDAHDTFWNNWVEATQSGGDQIDRSFRLTAAELHGSREIVLPVSYDQAVNAEGWGGGGFCASRVEPCTVSFEWTGTVTLKITPVGGGEAAPGPGTGTGPTPPPSKSTTGRSGRGCLVPHLKGRKLGKARKLLAGAGCKLGKVKRRKAGRSHRGKVMSQSKPPGRHLAAGAAVRVVVGR